MKTHRNTPKDSVSVPMRCYVAEPMEIFETPEPIKRSAAARKRARQALKTQSRMASESPEAWAARLANDLAKATD